MNRRHLLQLAGAALVSGAPAMRAYSFLTGNPLASQAWKRGFYYGANGVPFQPFVYSEAIHPNGAGYDLAPAAISREAYLESWHCLGETEKLVVAVADR